MDRPDLTVSTFMENFIGLKRVKSICKATSVQNITTFTVNYIYCELFSVGSRVHRLRL